MKSVLLFPYHPDVELLVKNVDQLTGYSVVGIQSFQEDQAVVKTVNKALGCSGGFKEMLDRCDFVLLLDDYRESRTEKYYEVIQAAVDAGKQVVVTPLMAQKLDIKEYQRHYTVLRNMPEKELTKLKIEPWARETKYIIDSPIIVVFGMGKSCCKFENQILLKSILDQEGYDFVWISSNPLGALFGGYTMPDFLYDDFAFEKKVIQFNQFVYQLSVIKKPDVFIIGVPEGISEFSAHEYNHFAEYPLVIGSAVSVDSAVLCTYFMPKLDVEGIEKITRHCRERFGFPVHMASIGRMAFEREREYRQIAYLFLEDEYLQKHYETVPNQPTAYVGVWEAEKTETAMRNIFDRLQGNPDAI